MGSLTQYKEMARTRLGLWTKATRLYVSRQLFDTHQTPVAAKNIHSCKIYTTWDTPYTIRTLDLLLTKVLGCNSVTDWSFVSTVQSDGHWPRASFSCHHIRRLTATGTYMLTEMKPKQYRIPCCSRRSLSLFYLQQNRTFREIIRTMNETWC